LQEHQSQVKFTAVEREPASCHTQMSDAGKKMKKSPPSVHGWQQEVCSTPEEEEG